jgi:hypothetical protein
LPRRKEEGTRNRDAPAPSLLKAVWCVSDVAGDREDGVERNRGQFRFRSVETDAVCGCVGGVAAMPRGAARAGPRLRPPDETRSELGSPRRRGSSPACRRGYPPAHRRGACQRSIEGHAAPVHRPGRPRKSCPPGVAAARAAPSGDLAPAHAGGVWI